MDEKQIMTVEEAAALLSVTPETVRRWARAGTIPAARVGGGWRFVREQLVGWVRERAAKP